MWMRQFLVELGFPPSAPAIICEDNKHTFNIFHKGRTKKIWILLLLLDIITFENWFNNNI